VAVLAVVGTVLVLRAINRPEGRLALDSLPEGVSAHEVEGVPVFLVRHGRSVEGFLDRAQHLANEQLWWCPAEEVFVSPFHGELFDAQGRALAGPAFRDLDRVSVEVTVDGAAFVDPFTVQRGAARNTQDEGLVDATVWTAYRSWSGLAAGEPSTFCQARIVGEGNPHT
jgi:nitrite reductase/ring-hydroxylating ferredoxin subunit